MNSQHLNPSLSDWHDGERSRLNESADPSRPVSNGSVSPEMLGWRTQVKFDSGLVFTAGQLEVVKPISSSATYAPGSWLCIYHKGRTQTRIEHVGEFNADPNSWSMIYSNEPIISHTSVQAGQRFEALALSVPCAWLDRLGATQDDHLSRFLAPAGDAPKTQRGKISPSLGRLTRDLLKPVGERAAERLRLEARLFDLLLQLAAEATSAGEACGTPAIEDSALESAKAILAAELHSPPTIPELALRVGMGATVLKKRFKARFGQTISEHTSNMRFERATQRLAYARTVAEVAYDVGMTPSAFSAAFRQRYGHPPKDLLPK